MIFIKQTFQLYMSMEPKNSSTCSQNPTNEPYPQSIQLTQSQTIFVRFILIL